MAQADWSRELRHHKTPYDHTCTACKTRQIHDNNVYKRPLEFATIQYCEMLRASPQVGLHTCLAVERSRNARTTSGKRKYNKDIADQITNFSITSTAQAVQAFSAAVVEHPRYTVRNWNSKWAESSHPPQWDTAVSGRHQSHC